MAIDWVQSQSCIHSPGSPALQRDVLHLYRQIAREAKNKEAEDRKTVMAFARGEFHRCLTKHARLQLAQYCLAWYSTRL